VKKNRKKIIFLQAQFRQKQAKIRVNDERKKIIKAQAQMRTYAQRKKFQEERQKIIKLQALIRGYLWRSRMKRLLKLFRAQKQIITKILNEEMEYNKNLQIGIEYYLRPLEKIDANFRKLFGNLEKLYNLHQRILSGIQRTLINYNFYANFGKIYSRDEDKLRGLYIYYVDNNFLVMNDLLAKVYKVKIIDSIVAEAKKHLPERFTNLIDFLELPIRHIKNYLPNIKQLQEKDPDNPVLKVTVAQIEQINMYIDQKYQLYEIDKKLVKLNKVNLETIMKSNRHLVRHGNINIGPKKKAIIRYFMLGYVTFM